MNPRSSANRRAVTATRGVTKRTRRTRVIAFDDESSGDESSDDEFHQAESSDGEYYESVAEDLSNELEQDIKKELRKAPRVKTYQQAEILVANLNKSVTEASELVEESATAAFRLPATLLEKGKNAIASLQRKFGLRSDPTTTEQPQLEFIPSGVRPTKKLKMLFGEDLKCPLCITTASDRISIHTKNRFVMTDCNHPFHENCLKDWLVNRKTCPFCRTEVLWVATNMVSGTEYVKNSLVFTV